MNVVIALETLSLRARASIVRLSAARIDPFSGAVEETFDRTATRESGEALGLTVDPSTLEFWRSRPLALRAEVFNDEASDLVEILLDFASWFSTTPEARVWANGVTLHLGALREAYATAEIELPWQHWLEHDLRTAEAFGATLTPPSPSLVAWMREHPPYPGATAGKAVAQANYLSTILQAFQILDTRETG